MARACDLVRFRPVVIGFLAPLCYNLNLSRSIQESERVVCAHAFACLNLPRC